MPVDLIVTPPPSILLRVQPMPRIVIIVGTGGGGGGAGTITEIQNAGGLVVTAGTGPIVQVAADFGSAAGKVTEGNDSRLSNARTPTAHKTSHQLGGTDEISVAGLTGLLATAQTPAAHKTTHATGGTDALVPSDIGAVPTSRAVSTGTGLLGGGNLTADRTLTPDFGAAAGKVMEGNQAPSGGQLGGTTLIAADVRGLRETSGPTLLTLGSVADGEFIKRVGATAVGEDLVRADPWFFFHKAPLSPHADDDEFTVGSLNVRWTAVKHGTWTAATILGPVDRTGAGSTQVKMTPNYRGTYLAWQGSDGGIIRNFTMPATLQIRFRVAAPGNGTGAASGPFANVYCGEYIAAAPDLTNNFCRLGWTNANTGNNKLWVATGRAGGGGGFDTTGPNMWGMTDDMEFIMVITTAGGTTNCSWFIRTGPTVTFLSAHAVGASGNFGAGRSAYIYVRFNNNASSGDPTAPANQGMIGICDYVRIRTDGDIEAY